LLSIPLLLLLLWSPNVVRMPRLEGGDEGGHGPASGGVRLNTVFGTPVESCTVHTFQDVCIFVKNCKANFDLMDSMPLEGPSNRLDFRVGPAH
jgi:hypothetical protein